FTTLFRSGVLRIVLELSKEELSGFAAMFATVTFAQLAIFNFLACVAVCVVASLTGSPAPAEKIQGLTLSTLTDEQKKSNRDSFTFWDIVASVLLLVIVLSVLIYFTG